MNEILPGVFHWTAFHPRIRLEVSSYYVTANDAQALIDPMLPDEGVEWFSEHGPPQVILLTNRHHYRRSGDFVDAFGCPVLCERSGLYEFEGGPKVNGFEFGDRLAPGISALEVDAICSEDSALHVEAGGGALAFADGIVHMGPEVGFVPDSLIGDDPEAVKRGLHESARRLLDRDFDSLLFAHGDPIVGEGRAALERFVDEGG
jgi:glyoxylase-like metal-dependent hydrolase (beta-lactamase superfamily II)